MEVFKESVSVAAKRRNRIVEIMRRIKICPECNGSGVELNIRNKITNCSRCKGEGLV